MSFQQVLRDTGTNLQVTFYTDETPTDPDGNTATVTITRSDGTTLVADSATIRTGIGVYKYGLADQTNLDYFTVVWKGTFGGLTQTVTDYVEIVGGFYFALADLRASDSSLADTTKYPTAKLVEARTEVQDEFENICQGYAFVPRFRRVTLSGSDRTTLLLPDFYIRSIYSLTVAAGASAAVAYTSSELADLGIQHGVVTRRTLGVFTLGAANIVMAYEHGLDVCPPDIRRAALVRARYKLVQQRGTVMDRASSFTNDQGNTYRLDTAGPDSTGIPDVDAVLGRYGRVPSCA